MLDFAYGLGVLLRVFRPVFIPREFVHIPERTGEEAAAPVIDGDEYHPAVAGVTVGNAQGVVSLGQFHEGAEAAVCVCDVLTHDTAAAAARKQGCSRQD
mgnify:CR=1 FL=1